MSDEEGPSRKRRGAEEDEDDEAFDLEFMQEKRQRPSADDFQLDESDEEHVFAVPAPPSRPRTMSDNHLVPFEMIPLSNVDAVRPEHAVVDAVSYYNHVSLLTLMYANVTQGISTPIIYDAKNQRMVTKEINFSGF